MTYLTDSYAKNDSMYPKDLKTRAMVDQRMQFDLGVLYKRTMDYYVSFCISGNIMQATMSNNMLFLK